MIAIHEAVDPYRDKFGELVVLPQIIHIEFF